MKEQKKDARKRKREPLPRPTVTTFDREELVVETVFTQRVHSLDNL